MPWAWQKSTTLRFCSRGWISTCWWAMAPGPQNLDGLFKLGHGEVGDPDLPGQAPGFGLGELLQIDRHRHLILGRASE